MNSEQAQTNTPFEALERATTGASFVRADLHIHSYGVSADVRDQDMTVENIIARAVDRRIEVLAVTDHNAIDAVEPAIAASADSGVYVLAGVELSASEGHLLAFFDPSNLPQFRQWFQRLPFEENAEGERWLLEPLHELANDIDAAGGIAIPAHVGRDGTGCLKKAPRKSLDALLSSRAVLAIEVDGPDEFDWFTQEDKGDGQEQRKEQLAQREDALGDVAGKRLSKLYFSDAHTLDQIGRNRAGEERLTRIKMMEPSFSAFVKALKDPDARIRLEDELPKSYPRIVGARIVGGFLDGQEIAFSPNLTCLIGGRGTGKSTALEAVRCTCDSLSHERETEDPESWPKAVQLIYQDRYGELHYLERTSGSDTIELTEGSAVPMTVAIEGYAQDRVAEIIRGYKDEPELLTEFLDRFTDLDATRQDLHTIQAQLVENAKQIAPLADAQERKKAAQRQLQEAETQLKAVEKSNLKEALQYRRLLMRERAYREAIDSYVGRISQDIENLRVDIDPEQLAVDVGIEDLAATPGAKYLLGDGEQPGIVSLLQTLGATLDTWRAEGQNAVKAPRQAIEALREEWVGYERRIEARVQQIVEELRAKGVAAGDVSGINKLTELEQDAKKAIKTAQQDIIALAKLRTTRRTLLDAYRHQQSSRYQRRAQAMKALTGALNESLTEFKVNIAYAEGQRVGEYEDWMRSVLGQRVFRLGRMTEFCQAIHPIDLADVLRHRAVAKLRALNDGNGNAYFGKDHEVSDFITLFQDADLHELEAIPVTDRPRITLTTLSEGTPRVIPFDSLSHGQKASILLGALLFSDDDTPLIIDQPEDHLDSAFIFETVVATLRSRKERRQVILATHNANIAVLGDAELIVPLQGYQGRGVVRDAGSVDSDETSKRACKVLEGGTVAYLRRGEMYGMEVADPAR